MRRPQVASVAALLLIAVMALNVLAARPSSAQTPGVYIALGDSIAAGIGSSLPRARGNAALVAEWLEQLTDATVLYQNLAVPGETAASFVSGGQLQQFRDAVERSNASGIPILAVTVSLGGNELLDLESTGLSDRQAGLDAFSEHYAEALASIRDAIGPDTPLVVTTSYDLTNGDPSIRFSDSWWIEQFNSVIRQVAEQQDAKVANVAERFDGRIDDFTHYPFDIHPSNAGQVAIAQAIWTALALDSEPPSIKTAANVVATRSTPTIRFTVADNVGVSSVTATSDAVTVFGPFEMSAGEYAILLDLGANPDGTVALTLKIGDDGGNVTQQVVTVQAAVNNRGESR